VPAPDPGGPAAAAAAAAAPTDEFPFCTSSLTLRTYRVRPTIEASAMRGQASKHGQDVQEFIERKDSKLCNRFAQVTNTPASRQQAGRRAGRAGRQAGRQGGQTAAKREPHVGAMKPPRSAGCPSVITARAHASQHNVVRAKKGHSHVSSEPQKRRSRRHIASAPLRWPRITAHTKLTIRQQRGQHETWRPRRR
jgi:hypothetical protein